MSVVSMVARLRSLTSALLSRRELEREMDEEWRFHVEARAEALAGEGLPRREAVRRARLEFGDPLRWKESSREALGVMWIYSLATDIGYGWRRLRRAPVFALTMIVTLALGIGANALAFSILHAVLVRDLPYPNPERVVLVWFSPPNAPDARGGSTLQNYFAVRDRSRAFEFVGSMSGVQGSIAVKPDDEGGGEPIVGQRIHATLLPALGIKPELGAWFSDADDPATAPRKILLSHRLWQSRFGGDPSVIGRLVRLDGPETTVVGVMPDGFEILDGAAQFWTPSRWSEATMASPSRMLVVAARLKPGVTLQQAQSEMDSLAENLARESPQTNQGWRIHLESIYDAYTRRTRGPLLMLQGVVALVLLIACANVVGLLLAQASTRRQELAMRIALGSSRGRLVRQLFTESALLAFLGAAVGIALASAGLRVFMAQDPAIWLPRASGIRLDARVLAFAAALSAASTVLFGLLPAWTLSRLAPIPAVRAANAAGGVPHGRVRAVLVSSQVAVALVLLVGAGLLINTMVRLNLNRPSIDPTNLLAFQVRLPLSEMVTPTGRDAGGFFTMKFSPRVSQIFGDIRERLSAVPGVQSVAASISPPATAAQFRMRVIAIGQPDTADQQQEPAGWFPVSADYFKTLGIAVRRGREFSATDKLGATDVAIVNETLARRLWPGEDPIGRQITIDFVNDPRRQIVGVVADVRETSEQRDFAPHVFIPEAQLPLASRGWFQAPRITMTYVVRTASDPMPLVASLRSAVADVYRTQPIFGIRTMREAMAEEIADRRQYLMLLGVFAGIAALLTLVGVYGLVAYGVGQRTQEIGIRRTLGANTPTILRLVLRQGLMLTAIGVAIGVSVSFATTRLLIGLLWGVSPTDPLTFAAGSVGLACAAFVACYVPARRALAINPMAALRSE